MMKPLKKEHYCPNCGEEIANVEVIHDMQRCLKSSKNRFMNQIELENEKAIEMESRIDW